jgi:hypothetical protein
VNEPSAAAADSALWIAVVGDARAPQELPRERVLTVGSSASKAELRIEGPGVAELHCAIGRVKGQAGFALKDLGSSAGTLLNGTLVRSAKLESGDTLQLGDAKLCVAASSAQAQSLRAALALKASSARPGAGAAGHGELSATQNLPPIKGYSIVKPLGRGGTGSVFQALQESLGRHVALKVLSEPLAKDADFVRRFQDEARAAAKLNHPHVVHVYDVWSESGRHFLSMEFMARGNLEARVTKQGPLPWPEVLGILLDAAKGLEYAEQRGIVHRDIKPANLMQDEHGVTKIADLGLATQIEAEATESENKKIFGTPHFISPEQIRGEKVDSRSDLYSLGCTAYRLLCARTPFEGATTRDILRGHLKEAPRALDQVVGGVPSPARALVERLMQKDPSLRPASAAALRAELERLREGGSLAGGRGRGRLGRWLAAALLLAAAGGAAWNWLARPATPGAGRPGGMDSPSAAGTAPLDPPAPEPGPDQDVEPPLAAGPVQDDDSALRARELEAESAYRALSSQLAPQERRTALSELIQRYADTNRAREFELELAELARAEAAEAAAGQTSASPPSALDTELGYWRRLVEAQPPGASLGAVLEALLADPGPSSSGGASGGGAREQALRECLQAAEARAARATREFTEAIQAGAFDGLDERARAELASLESGALPPELEVPLRPTLEELGRSVAELKALAERLPQERTRYAQDLARADARDLASLLRSEQGLREALARFDLPGFQSAIARAQGAGRTPASAAFLEELSRSLAAGRAALDALVREHKAGNWKRRTLSDPRERGHVLREVLAADGDGLTLKAETGTERLAWSEFAARPRDLHQVFLNRLQRDWSAEERSGVAFLVWTASVAQVARATEEWLERPARGRIGPGERGELLEGFALAREWASGSELERVARESAAVELWLDAGAALADKRWTLAASRLETLLAEHADALLVRLLSDGGGLALAGASAQGGDTAVGGAQPR